MIQSARVTATGDVAAAGAAAHVLGLAIAHAATAGTVGLSVGAGAAVLEIATPAAHGSMVVPLGPGLLMAGTLKVTIAGGVSSVTVWWQ